MKTLQATAILLALSAVPAFAHDPSTHYYSASGSGSGSHSNTNSASAGYAGAGGTNTSGGTISATSVSGGTGSATAGHNGTTTSTLQSSEGGGTGKGSYFNGGANDIAGASFSHYTYKYTHSGYSGPGTDP